MGRIVLIVLWAVLLLPGLAACHRVRNVGAPTMLLTDWLRVLDETPSEHDVGAPTSPSERLRGLLAAGIISLVVAAASYLISRILHPRPKRPRFDELRLNSSLYGELIEPDFWPPPLPPDFSVASPTVLMTINEMRAAAEHASGVLAARSGLSERPKSVGDDVNCLSCGARVRLVEGQGDCAYCGRRYAPPSPDNKWNFPPLDQAPGTDHHH
jgi:hypothetical protein